MKFLSNNQKTINILIIISAFIDAFISFLINLLSQSPFYLWSKTNIITIIILVILILAFAICNILTNKHQKGAKPKKLQKAFQESGGYDVAAAELKKCIEANNMKRLRSVKRMVHIIEK